MKLFDAIMSSTAAEWVSAIFAMASVAAALFTLWSANRATRTSFRLEWTRDVVKWGSRALHAMADAHSLCAARSAAVMAELPARGRVLSDISALIDQGRLFFENREVPGEGSDKPSAFRGKRPVLLDYLVAAHDCLRDATLPAAPGAPHGEMIWGLRREFVSELQRIVDPRWLSSQVKYTGMKNA